MNTSTATKRRLAALQALIDTPQRQPVQTSGRGLDPRLHQYQRRAVQHLWDHPRAALFLEMGLGKTAATLQALTTDHLPALVIAPKRVAEKVWPSEAGTWRPDLTLELAAGSPAKRAAALDSGADLVVIGRDNIADVVPGKFQTVILDESSSFKNRGTQRWKKASRICQNAAYVWALTGTPSPNGYLDLWPQVHLLDGGYRLGKTLTAYRQRYFFEGRRLNTGVVVEWKLAPGSEDAINDKLADIAMSMQSKDYLELPPVTTNEVGITLPPKVRAQYERLREDLAVQFGSQDITAANQAVVTGKLSQITAGFLYPDTDSPEDTLVRLHDAKTEAVQEIIDGTGSPVLVFYRFREELARLKAARPQARTIDDRGAIEDWNSGTVPVLLAHPASAGHGLNLQAGGHTIVWTTPTWSSEEYQQANARLNRQGQTRPVTIHHVVAADSVDGLILDAVQGKVSVQDALLAALGLDNK